MAGPSTAASTAAAPSWWDRLVGSAGRPQVLRADPAAVEAASAAGGAALDSINPAGFLDGFVDELHDQEERAATFLRWGTVALIALAAIIVVCVLAWFFAPARALAGRLAG